MTPPTGFTQNKKTPMTSNNYTFKQAGTLPDTYQADGKTYKLKGWYKGKTKPNTLTTTKAPSYAVTYDGNDDLNVVYEEVVPRDTWVYPGFYAEFVDEQGKAFTNPLTFSGNYTQFLRKKIVNIFETTGNLYPMIGSKDPSQSNKYKIETQSRIPISATYDGNVTGDVYDKREYGLHDLTITNELKYVDKIEVMDTSLQAADYLVGYVGIDPILIDFPNILHPLERAFIKNTNQRFSINAIFGANGSASTIPRLLRIGGKDQPNQRNVTLMGFDGTTNYKHTMNYKVTRKQVTENFVDTNGTKITPPTGFTQNKKTPMTSNNYTFKQAGTLPDTYTTGGKTYKFKGWYKGKVIPNTLTTTKAPSYAVTYDDNDDLNVVYEEETVTTLYPSINMNFVNEKGGTFTPALTFSGKYYAQSTSASLRTDLYDVTSKNNGSGQYTVSINNGSMPLSQELLKKYNNGQPISATNRLQFNVDKLTINQQLKYVDTIQVDTAQSSSLNYYGHKYTSGSSTIFDPNIAPTEYNMTTEQINSLNFSSDGTYFSNANNRFFNMHLGYNSSGGSLLLMMALFNENPVNQTKLVYKVTRKQVTENFVDANGAKITPPTGFTQGNKIPMTSNTFKYTAAKALPATYTAGGKTYTFQGWYKGKTKPNTLTTSTTPTYNTTFDGNDDMTAMYKEVTAVYPGFYAQFVDEQGKAFTNPLTLSGNYTEFLRKTGTTVFETKGAFYPMVGKRDTTVTNKYKIETTSSVAVPNNYWTAMPADIANRGYALNNLDITNQMKYVDKIETTDTHTTMYDYTGVSDIGGKPNNTSQTELNPIDKTFVKQTDNTFAIKSIWGNGTFSHIVPKMLLLAESGSFSRLFGFDGTPDYKQTVNYKVTRKQVTENFVDANGTKITPPTGFTQGNQIPMTSNTFKYTAAKALPATYTAGGKTYTFQGWYKGKTKPNTLTTSTTPTYNTTFDGNDDMTAMYKEVTAVYPGFYAQFVDEQGKAFTNPLTLSGNYTEFLRKTGTTVFETKGAFYPMVGKRDTTVTNKYKIETTSSVAVPNNYWTAMPADIANRGYALNNLDITNQMKYVDKIETTDTHTTMYDYTGVSDIGGKPNNTSQTELNPIDKTFVKQTDNTFAIKSIWGNGTFSHIVPKMLLLAESGSFSRLFGFDGTPDYKQTVNYKVTRKQVTENFVDANGTKITPPTGFTQGNQIPMTSNTFKYTAAKALPATYTAGGKTYTFQGWYKGKTKPNTLTTSTTPTYNTTFDGNDDMTAMYKEEVPKASVALTRTTAETVTSGGNVTWRATITNTSQAPLTTATIKKSTAWTTGLAAPTAMIVTPAGGTAKTVPVTATTWTNGVSLGTDIPVGKSATVQFTTKATGTAGQVLRAGITTSGNYSGVSTSATVRVKDNDQAIVTPTAEGFISVPTFNFGQVGVAGSTQQHGLKKAADYYGNGTRNPYLRIKKTQPNWSLTAQLSQPKSATDSLPTATRLLLGAAPVSSFSNYNQPTELKNAVGTTSAISLNANNTATRIIANQQFTGSNIYQLDFTFNNVKLEVPANQGVKGQQYQAAVTWNLVTGP
ncbi:WxL domain-containing protein [Enterococcus faecalis]|uniref:WxL domain-containing protein n=3 Tax=Enterococcus faecalis TaxID=1351 RepID=UPI0035CC2697